jgi:hypothetical protein
MLSNDDDYVLPHPRIELLKKIILAISLPAAWNERFYQNRTTFKIALKDHLLYS